MPKHKYIETPEKMWELFCEYRETIKANPRKKMVFGGKDFVSDYELLERPLTIEGFRNFAHSQGVTVNHYFANTDNAYDEYRTICSHITEEIRQDQIEGGMVGQYNPSITQRLNGLTDKIQQDINANVTQITGMEIK